MIRLIVAALAVVLGSATAAPARAETRIALVIGNATYAQGALPTALPDGGLVAEALNSAGFEIVEGADLNQANLRRTFRDFLEKVEAAGPDALVFVYYTGLGLAFEGDNYLVPVDARLERESDIPLDAVRVSDLIRPLAAAPARAKIVVLDASRALPFKMPDAQLPAGLIPMEPPPGMLVSYAAAPGVMAPESTGAYGAFATAIAEMVREPGLDLDAAFARIRIRTHQATEGAQTPWHMSALQEPIVLVPGEPVATAPRSGAPAAVVSAPPKRRPVRPMRDIEMEEAYALAIEQDTLPAYVEFVQSFPRSPYAPRVWATIRSRREALAWMRALDFNTPESYWTYLRRYPDGIYAGDARRRLRRLAARLEPPSAFAPVEFADVPPPLAEEPVEYIRVYPAAPPPPARLIAPPPAFFVNLPPPPRPRGPRFLPVPVPLQGPVPNVQRPPRVGVAPAVQTPPAAVVPPGRLPPPAVTPGRRGAPPPAQAVVTPGTTPTGAPPPTTAPAATNVGTPPSSATLPPPRGGRGERGDRRNAGRTPPTGTPPAVTAIPQTGAAGPATSTPPADPKSVAPAGRGGRGVPPAVQTSTTPPTAVRTLPPGPPTAVRTLPPGPPTAVRTPPPGPPTAVRTPPPGPPTAVRTPPPPPPTVVRTPPPPQKPAAAPPPKPVAGKKCEIVDGKQVCR